MNVGVVGNARYHDLTTVLRSVAESAVLHGARLFTEAELQDHLSQTIGLLEPGVKLDAMITLGGDGTLLRGARFLGGRPVPILGINLGRVGFLTAATRRDYLGAVDALFSRKYGVEARQALASGVVGPDHSLRPLPNALNDVVIHKTGVARIVRLEVLVDGESVGPYSADGIIIATPTGSTAYSLSAGGPIIAPGVEALSITPICAHTLAVRPLVIRISSVITVRPMPGWEHDVLISVDGQAVQVLQPGEMVQLRNAPEKVHLVQLAGTTYFQRIRHTLQWGDLSDRAEP